MCWLNGEGSIPTDTVERLLALNVRELRYFVDNESAGENSAKALAARLRGSPIAVTAYRLPGSLGPTGDINDLWCWCKFDAAEFTRALETICSDGAGVLLHQIANLPPGLETPPSAQYQARESRDRSTGQAQTPDWDDESSRWKREEVMPALDLAAPVVKWEGRIERRHCPNPQHTDRDPSFRISYDHDSESGIPQCSCGIQSEPHPWDKVAEWVRARPFTTWFKEERAQHYPLWKTRSSPHAAVLNSDMAVPISTSVMVDADPTVAKSATWPYLVKDNRMMCVNPPNMNGEVTYKLIADFYAQIVETITTSSGETLYRVKGENHDGEAFSFEIEAEAFSDTHRLKAKLEAAAGPRCSVAVRMSEHLGPAIKLLTDHSTTVYQFDRTGWHGGKFLLPGHTPSEVKFSLPRKLPFCISADADLETGLQVLIEAIPVEASLPALTFLFQAPLAQLMDSRRLP
ncbi:MAG: hypothetical protein ABI700_09960 [Chloroflexota bacterium]